MRIAATVAATLIFGVGVFAAALAGLHAFRGPRTEKLEGVAPLRDVGPFVIDPSPLDREQRRVDAQVTDANHAARFTLAGRVRPSGTRRVRLIGQGKKGRMAWRATPNAEGRFEISDLPRGRYELLVYGGRYPIVRQVELDSDRMLDLTRPEVRLSLEVVLSGTPLEPLQKAFVMLFLSDDAGGAVVAHGRTDRHGKLLLDGVPEGKLTWRIWASATDAAAGTREWHGELTTPETGEPLRLRLQ